ncbi:hypothetical protein L195_g060343, partial [Trifolium pratense]
GSEVWVCLQGIDGADEYLYQFSGLSLNCLRYPRCRSL